MHPKLSRRDFLKITGFSLSSLAFPWPPYQPGEHPNPTLMGRVTIDEVDVYSEPRSDVSLITGKRYRDQVIALYWKLTPPEGPAYNPIWYRLWGGYVHSAYLQLVKIHFNRVIDSIPSSGLLCEVSVPYTEALRYTSYRGWEKQYRLYYSTTHWITGIEEGPDGEAWYQVTNELDKLLTYFVRADHLRSIPEEELTPISPGVSPEEKRLEVSIQEQVVRAYEGDRVVLETKVSTGIHSTLPPTNGIPTHTPRGEYRIASKSPSKHMGSVQTTGAPGGYSLPGVPWTSFFIPETGVAFHGTYWHNNFGAQMSHGCVNMSNSDAKWLFRWSTPFWKFDEDAPRWDARGYGTKVNVI